MSLYDKSSLIQVPSLYKDGTLVSTIPEDRSGDFTVVRGSNLSATRVGEDGYIKKGYENLLLQSNTFSDAAWNKAVSQVTGGQLGYDSTNDAWLLEKTNSNGRVEISVSGGNVLSYSVYAKKNASNQIRITGDTCSAYFNLNDGTLGSVGATTIAAIDLIGDGWYRCTATAFSSTSVFRIYPAENNSTSSLTSGSIYIQDAQLNQGLVAYPYLETTTAPVQGGLLENTPRLDWSNGVPAVLIEEGRTNLLSDSEYYGGFSFTNISIETNSETSPEGLQNASSLIDTISNVAHRLRTESFSVTSGEDYTVSLFIKKGSVNYLQLTFSSGQFGTNSVWFDLSDFSIDSISSGHFATIKEFGNDWYELTYTANCTASGVCFLFVNPSDSTSSIFYAGSGSANLHLYGLQLEQASTPSSYIPTYGTSQTRSSETISDNFNIPTTATIYNSFYSDVAETVFVLDQVFNVVEGLNKVAIAFSPTAVKISVGGSIVANATGTYDTSSLTNIQLGSDNGSDYSNAPISGFYVFPEFLTDEELNSLTA
jgi:hypothetical protein